MKYFINGSDFESLKNPKKIYSDGFEPKGGSMTKFKSDEEKPEETEVKIKRNAHSQAFATTDDDRYSGVAGLSKREYMATHLLAGFVANPQSRHVYAQEAVEAADILLKTLAETEVGQTGEDGKNELS